MSMTWEKLDKKTRKTAESILEKGARSLSFCDDCKVSMTETKRIDHGKGGIQVIYTCPKCGCVVGVSW